MSLKELMPAQDTPVTVGVMARQGEQMEVPVYIVDLGADCPPIDGLIERSKRLLLDTQPIQNGFMYYVTSDRVLCEITGDDLDRALSAPSPEDMLRKLVRSGTPEFSSCVDVGAEVHARFTAARSACGGHWVFIALTQAATQVVLSSDDMILMITSGNRDDYPIPE